MHYHHCVCLCVYPYSSVGGVTVLIFFTTFILREYFGTKPKF